MDEVQRLILQVENEQKLQALTLELRKERDILEQLVTLKKTAPYIINPEALDVAARKVAALNTEVRKLTTEVSKGNPMNKFAITYMIDDFANSTGSLERRLTAISNNIPQLLQMFGKNAPWVAGVSLAATGVLALYTHMDQLIALFAGDKPKKIDYAFKGMTERIKETSKAFEEFLTKVETPSQKEMAGIFKKALEGLGPEFMPKLTEAILPAGAAEQLAKARAAHAKAIESAGAKGIGGVPLFDVGQQQKIIADAEAKLQAATARATKGFGAQAEHIMRGAIGGDVGFGKQVLDLAQKKSEIFGPEIVGRLQEANPEVQAKRAEQKKWAAEGHQKALAAEHAQAAQTKGMQAEQEHARQAELNQFQREDAERGRLQRQQPMNEMQAFVLQNQMMHQQGLAAQEEALGIFGPATVRLRQMMFQFQQLQAQSQRLQQLGGGGDHFADYSALPGF